jgi:NADPH-dependent glutamate synthase beta subunit-like oxidoreductase
MDNPAKIQRIEQFQNMRVPLNMQAALVESNRCLLCYDAPCSAACPAGTDPAKFIRQIKFHNYKGAARTIRNNNILGGTCAHICPVEQLCEKECSIKALEDPINIAGLQQFAVDYGITNSLESTTPSKKTKGKIAIIGGGPAGLACASSLLNKDFSATIFEREDKAGGVPIYNIPEFRLPEQVITNDINNLLNQGVEFMFNSPIEDKESISKLLSQGFDSVFISTGLSVPITLDLLQGYDNAYDYNSFLRQHKFGQKRGILQGKIIAVIGGGSVAIDSAVTAKACGAKKVYLITLEQLHELPAEKEEIELAHMMGIIIKSGSQIIKVKESGNHISSLSGVEVEPIESRQTNPSNTVIIDGTQFSINVDLVIQAIGTKPGSEISEFDNNLQTDENGIIQVADNYQTNIPFIFAAGDVVNGGKTVVQAIGEGKKAATSIINFLSKRTTI